MSSDQKDPKRSHDLNFKYNPEEINEEQVNVEKNEMENAHLSFEEMQFQIEELQKLAEEHKQKAEENYELYLRARADVENTRRRSRNEKEQALKYAYVPLLESLLPVLDNFERALIAAQDSKEKTLKEGVEMVYRHFLQVLSEAGLSVIEAEGKPFDPHFHNAVMQVESKEVESGIVVEELQTGYCYLDRVIRPTMVKVSK